MTGCRDTTSQVQPKNILAIFALNSTTPAYTFILDNLKLKLSQEYGDSYNLHVEYLEIERYPAGEYPKNEFDVYNKKYKDINLDLLICIGRNIIAPLKKSADPYFFNLPVIAVDYDFSIYGYYSDLNLNSKTALIGLTLNFEKTIAFGLKLFPQTSSVYFISGASKFDTLLMSLSKPAARKLCNGMNVTFISNLSMYEIINLVGRLPEKSIIFIPVFNTDAEMVTYYNSEAIRLISREAKAPVFPYSNIGIGDGAIGGYVNSHIKTGLLIGDYAVKILKGTDPKMLIASERDYYDYVFDWRVLKQWNLLGSGLIPEGSTILFEEENILDRYKWLISGVIIFLIFQTFLIVNLFRLNRNQKVMTKKIIEKDNKHREFLHVDRSLRVGHLAVSLSHELNQPLTAILSTAQAGINFINSNEADPGLLKQILERIVENNKRTSSILSSLRGMMKLESRKKEKVNLNSLINEVIAVYQSELSKSNCKLLISIPENPVLVLADSVQIQQVLLNLIQNALQALGRTNGNTGKIEITQQRHGGEVIVSVRDYGKGIDETVKEKLFKPFNTSKKEGTGIGLAICRSIIEDHQGKIWAENLPDGGARFSFSLNIYE